MNAFHKILLATVFALAAALSAANAPIQLLRAQSIVVHYPTYAQQVPTVDAIVAAASGQQVSVHLQTFSGDWVDVGMSYSRPASNGYQVWTANLSSFLMVLGPAPFPLTFALKEVVNGQTYWDNNGGNNYSLAPDSGSYLPSANVYDGSYVPAIAIGCTGAAAHNVINGNVTLRNIAYAKTVNIVYSTDNWATVQTASASYSAAFWMNAFIPGNTQTDDSYASNPNAYNFEEWSYSIDIGTASTVQYAVSYTVNGQTYWDNNFNHNYTVSFVCS